MLWASGGVSHFQSLLLLISVLWFPRRQPLKIQYFELHWIPTYTWMYIALSGREDNKKFRTNWYSLYSNSAPGTHRHHGRALVTLDPQCKPHMICNVINQLVSAYHSKYAWFLFYSFICSWSIATHLQELCGIYSIGKLLNTIQMWLTGISCSSKWFTQVIAYTGGKIWLHGPILAVIVWLPMSVFVVAVWSGIYIYIENVL